MPYMVVLGLCVRCRAVMSFNPETVPSVRVDGEREPLCEPCVRVLNGQREAAGLPPFVIPAGAYEPAETD
jgi:hypothetical protein